MRIHQGHLNTHILYSKLHFQHITGILESQIGYKSLIISAKGWGKIMTVKEIVNRALQEPRTCSLTPPIGIW